MDDKTADLTAQNQALGAHVNELTQQKISLHTMVIRLETLYREAKAEVEKLLGEKQAATDTTDTTDPTTPTPSEPTDPAATPAS